jgi:hypothetical protein
MRGPLAVLAAFFDRLGCYVPAATVAGFAFSPLTAASVPELNAAIAHLRDVLGDQVYESLAREGEKMPTAAMATYEIRPNRPSPNRTEHSLEIEEACGGHDPASVESVLRHPRDAEQPTPERPSG